MVVNEVWLYHLVIPPTLWLSFVIKCDGWKTQKF